MPFYTKSKNTFEVGGREFPRVTWYKDSGMRSLYIALMFAVLTSATNGYDGSMMNGLQALDEWKACQDSSSTFSKLLLTFEQRLTIQMPPQEVS